MCPLPGRERLVAVDQQQGSLNKRNWMIWRQWAAHMLLPAWSRSPMQAGGTTTDGHPTTAHVVGLGQHGPSARRWRAASFFLHIWIRPGSAAGQMLSSLAPSTAAPRAGRLGAARAGSRRTQVRSGSLMRALCGAIWPHGPPPPAAAQPAARPVAAASLRARLPLCSTTSLLRSAADIRTPAAG